MVSTNDFHKRCPFPLLQEMRNPFLSLKKKIPSNSKNDVSVNSSTPVSFSPHILLIQSTHRHTNWCFFKPFWTSLFLYSCKAIPSFWRNFLRNTKNSVSFLLKKSRDTGRKSVLFSSLLPKFLDTKILFSFTNSLFSIHSRYGWSVFFLSFALIFFCKYYFVLFCCDKRRIILGVLFHSLSTGVFLWNSTGRNIRKKESQYSLQNNKVLKAQFYRRYSYFWAFFSTIASLSYLDASDNYNNVSIKAIFDNGVSSHLETSQFTTYFQYFSLKIFGFRNEILPFLLFCTIGITVFTLLRRKENSQCSWSSFSISLAVSPWSISSFQTHMRLLGSMLFVPRSFSSW